MLNDAEFLLVRNLQGDVTKVINAEDGSTYVYFTYDAWGNVTYNVDGVELDDISRMVITALCPVTYRGYNYDFTTGLYYLQSRYYNPQWGRFLNTDDTSILLSSTGTTHGANMYLYCDNNPVNRVDYTGKRSFKTTEEMAANIITEIALIYLIYINPRYSYICYYEFVDCTFDVDKYGLIIFRLMVYDGASDCYYTTKIVVGSSNSWYRYVVDDNSSLLNWGEHMMGDIKAQIEKSMEMQFSHEQSERDNNGLALMIVLGFDSIIYVGGVGVIHLIKKGASFNPNDYGLNSFGLSGLVGYTGVNKTKLKSTAYVYLHSSSKPRRYNEVWAI